MHSFIDAEDVNSSNLQLLDAAIATAASGVRRRACDDTQTTVNVRLWRHLAINEYAVEQQLFKAYVRSQRLEKLGARDATHVRIQYELRGEMVGGYARINNFFVYGGDREFRMLVNLDIINTACVDVEIVRNSSLVHGGLGARGRGRGRGAGPARSQSAAQSSAQSAAQSALLLRVLPGGGDDGGGRRCCRGIGWYSVLRAGSVSCLPR